MGVAARNLGPGDDPTIDSSLIEFLKRFNDPNTYVSPDDAKQQFDRLMSTGNPEFQKAASTMLSQMDSNQFSQAVHTMDATQRLSFVSKLVAALKDQGLKLESVASTLGVNAIDPSSMGPTEVGELARFAQRESPAALQNAAREEPSFLKALGNPLVAGAIAVMGATLLSRMKT
jgi:hypothetical protein